ncbi:MAG: hypothetical protein ACOCXQ_03800 [Patescibacteria group bacterium]
MASSSRILGFLITLAVVILVGCNALPDNAYDAAIMSKVYQSTNPQDPIVVTTSFPKEVFSGGAGDYGNLQVLQVGSILITNPMSSLELPQSEGFGIGGNRLYYPEYYKSTRVNRLDYNSLVERVVLQGKPDSEPTTIHIKELEQDLDFTDGILNYPDLRIALVSNQEFHEQTAVYVLSETVSTNYLVVDQTTLKMGYLKLSNGTVSISEESFGDEHMQDLQIDDSPEFTTMNGLPEPFHTMSVRSVSSGIEVAVPLTLSISVHN